MWWAQLKYMLGTKTFCWQIIQMKTPCNDIQKICTNLLSKLFQWIVAVNFYSINFYPLNWQLPDWRSEFFLPTWPRWLGSAAKKTWNEVKQNTIYTGKTCSVNPQTEFWPYCNRERMQILEAWNKCENFTEKKYVSAWGVSVPNQHEQKPNKQNKPNTFSIFWFAAAWVSSAHQSESYVWK